MNPIVRAAAPLFLVGVVIGGPAFAADYEPPLVIDDSVDEYVPIEIGNGWYLRGDVSYTANKPEYAFSPFGKMTANNRFGGSVGIGYQFTDWLRADATLGYIGGSSLVDNSGPAAVSTSQDIWGGMVNGYVDLGTFVGLTPYLGAGAGMVRNSYKIDAPLLGFDAVSKTQYEFAYAMMAGIAYDVTKNVSVDLGYRYLAAPSARYLNAQTVDLDKGIDHHQVRVGLRYALW